MTKTGRGSLCSWRLSPGGRIFKLLLALFLVAGGALRAGEAGTNSPGEISLKLKRPISYVAQSTNGTCWLACAAMVWGYYGKPTDEKALSQKVRDITLKQPGGELRANRRECLIALAQDGGLTEAVFRQFAAMGADLTNQLASVGKGVSQVTNSSGTGTSTKISLASTNGSKSWLFSGGKLNFHPEKFLMGEIQEYTQTVSPELMVDALKNQEPVVIVCRLGRWSKEQHAMVVVGLTVAAADPVKPQATPKVISVEVLDPAAESAIPVVKTAEYLKANLKGVYTKSQAEKILENERDSVVKS